MFPKVLYALLIVAECVIIPFYNKAQWPKKTKRSLVLKMCCATVFVALGLLAMLISGNTGSYATILVIGLLFSWAGDFLLHVKPGSLGFFLMGLVAFLIAHIFYISAYLQAQKDFFPEMPLFFPWEIAVAVGVSIVFIVGCYIGGVRFEKALVPCCAYSLFVTTMLLKASTLGIRLFIMGADNSAVLMPLFILGGINFVLSDSTLALINFDTKYKKYKLKVFNIITYFAAQVFLASTILFI